MSKGIVEIQSQTFSSAGRFFFDTNVWLCLYGPVTATKRREAKVYSRALRDMRCAQSRIYLDPLVLSEFINTFARQEWQKARDTDRSVEDFKSFRNGPLFPPIAEEIACSATKMLRLAKRCQWRFDAADVGSMLAEFAQGHTDFNDQALAGLCKEQALTLVTHDADFKGTGIPILTANRRLLA